MEKVIYNNGSSMLVANLSGDLVELTQYLDNEFTGYISVYIDELDELYAFVKENYDK